MKLTVEELAAKLCEMDHRRWDLLLEKGRDLYRSQARRFLRAVNKLKAQLKVES